MRKWMLVLGTVLLGLVVTAAYADLAHARGGFAPDTGPQGMRGDRGGRMLERLDTDGDGKVSRAEYDARFATLDTNNDGYVTREEIDAARDERRAQRREQMFKRQDANGDGRIALDEFTGPARLFARIDADHDGYITEQEAQEFKPARGDMRRGRRGGQGGPCMNGTQPAPGPGGPGGMGGPY